MISIEQIKDSDRILLKFPNGTDLIVSPGDEIIVLTKEIDPAYILSYEDIVKIIHKND